MILDRYMFKNTISLFHGQFKTDLSCAVKFDTLIFVLEFPQMTDIKIKPALNINHPNLNNIYLGLPWALLSELVYQIKFTLNQQKGIMAHFEHYVSLTDLKWLILWFVCGMHKLYYAMYMIADPDGRFGEGYQYRNGIFKSINVLLTFSKERVCVLWWHASVPYIQNKIRQQATCDLFIPT